MWLPYPWEKRQALILKIHPKVHRLTSDIFQWLQISLLFNFGTVGSVCVCVCQGFKDSEILTDRALSRLPLGLGCQGNEGGGGEGMFSVYKAFLLSTEVANGCLYWGQVYATHWEGTSPPPDGARARPRRIFFMFDKRSRSKQSQPGPQWELNLVTHSTLAGIAHG